ncbi:MAG: endolytic transglycosylase MltG [Bryobacterales bacterium]|nr:endolytic transglycosylase MltG [Bryobacteraceae bacterium]MDW8130673.1 endolytic transglycosylase MltG [Bryobacterales bacterium]
MEKLLAALIVPLLVAAALVSLALPHAAFQGETFVMVPRGTSSFAIGRMLAEAGVIRYRWQFWLARLLRPTARLQAGEYRFDRPASTWEVFDRLVRGDVFYYELTVPEGSNMFEIAAALERLGVVGSDEFLKEARQPAMIRDLAPRAPTLEGYLFPDTYRITRNTTAREICRQMTARFRQVWRALNTPADVHETVTLASLIEKETAIPEERPLVASVFLNRLRLGMPLACDPTVIYAALLEERYRGALYRSDLESEQPYNTYRRPGLPPGPIANPGVEAIRAAINPARTDYLYFVAIPDGSGRHQFSTDLASHQRAVARYRRGQKANQRPRPPG